MRVALFIGDHRDDTLLVRLGWAATRLVQRGDFRRVTHVEAILEEWPDGCVTIGSATLRKENQGRNGVRVKPGVRLNPANWLMADVPQWSVERAREWFAQHVGELYDVRGAVGTAVPLVGHNPRRKFCNWAVGAPFLRAAHTFGPAQFAAICFTFGRDVTEEFFTERA